MFYISIVEMNSLGAETHVFGPSPSVAEARQSLINDGWKKNEEGGWFEKRNISGYAMYAFVLNLEPYTHFY